MYSPCIVRSKLHQACMASKCVVDVCGCACVCVCLCVCVCDGFLHRMAVFALKAMMALSAPPTVAAYNICTCQCCYSGICIDRPNSEEWNGTFQVPVLHFFLQHSVYQTLIVIIPSYVSAIKNVASFHPVALCSRAWCCSPPPLPTKACACVGCLHVYLRIANMCARYVAPHVCNVIKLFPDTNFAFFLGTN